MTATAAGRALHGKAPVPRKATARAVRMAAGAIKRGGTVVFPTETVYGLGADALNPRAVARIFEIKGRPRFDPLIVHVSSVTQAGAIARLTPEARALMARFWPGPLTLVLPRKKPVPGIVTAGLDTVAVRMPAHPVALALIRAAGTPIAAPSANRFGRLSPTTAAHASAQLRNGPDAVLDGGRARIGVESTVLALNNGTFTILRHGGLSQEEIEKVTGPLPERLDGRSHPASPGQLSAHYAPSAALVLLRSGEPRLKKGVRYGYLAFAERTGLPVKACAVLSPSRDMEEAAANLFSHLHDLDAAGVDVILAEPVPDRGLGRAIMDRLRRAARGRGRK